MWPANEGYALVPMLKQLAHPRSVRFKMALDWSVSAWTFSTMRLMLFTIVPGRFSISVPNSAPMLEHHPLCDWNVDQKPEYCICGVCQKKAPWLDAYIRAVVRQAAHLSIAPTANRTTGDLPGKGRAA